MQPTKENDPLLGSTQWSN